MFNKSHDNQSHVHQEIKRELFSDTHNRLSYSGGDYDIDTNMLGERASNMGVVLFSSIVFILPVAIINSLFYMMNHAFSFGVTVFSIFVAVCCALSIHIAQQWEQVVVLRLGKFNRLGGPGLFFTIPILESTTMRVDKRIRVTTFGAEETLTSDLVPIGVNAVLFWMVWDAKAACMEVGDFTRAVELAAQTALRDAIGRAGAADVAIRRQQLDRELKKDLEEKVAPWGVSILSVEIRDILLPEELQHVMSLEAQAEQRKKARMILMETEEDICAMIDEMSETYSKNEVALKIRQMHLLYEGVSETNGTIVVPSSFAEGFGDILPKS